MSSQKWVKRGRVLAPDTSLWWSQRYCMIPTPELRATDVIRVYYATADDNNYSRVTWVDLDADDPRRIVAKAPGPVLDLGEAGCFDDSGANATSVLDLEGGEKLLFYAGYQRSQRLPYVLFGGLAVSEDGGDTFRRYRTTPILERLEAEETVRSAPCVVSHNDTFHMWYVAGERWLTLPTGKLIPQYVIKHLESSDPYRWNERGTTCIGPATPDEIGFGRPWVVYEDGRFFMWYSIRSRISDDVITYTGIGSAESADGVEWERRADLELTASDSGWDSEMVCYGAVLALHDRGARYMFYNGDGNGATGFGVAEMDASS